MKRALACLLLMATTAMAQEAAQEQPSCSSLDSVDIKKSYNADDRLIRNCINKGWEPPLSWRANEGKSPGVRVGGTAGISINARQAPENPPGKAGAAASVSANQFRLSFSLPPWRGFPCQLPAGIDVCGSTSSTITNADGTTTTVTSGNASGTGTSANCAISADETGTFGTTQALSGSTSVTCGGSVALSSYRLTLNPSPAGLFITNAGARNAWAYRASGSTFSAASTTNASLPTYLCNYPSRKDASDQGRIQIPLPIAQMITWTANSTYITVRLQPESTGDVLDPFDPIEEDDEPEHYLVLPISNGVPQIPGDCALASSYYRTLPPMADAMIVESATTPGCEGNTVQCAGQSTVPTATTSCESASLTPTSATSTQCSGQIQIVPLDRPSLVFPPGSSISTTTLGGSPVSMVATGSDSVLYTATDTNMYFGQSSQRYTLPEGGTVKLDNGNILRMNGPAQFNPGGRSVTLPNGGSIQSSGGALVQTIGSGGSSSIDASYPLIVRLGRNIEMPAGYLIPTQPTATVRLPVATE